MVGKLLLFFREVDDPAAFPVIEGGSYDQIAVPIDPYLFVEGRCAKLFGHSGLCFIEPDAGTRDDRRSEMCLTEIFKA